MTERPDEPAEGSGTGDDTVEDDLARALEEGPLDWPEDTSAPPADDFGRSAVGLPPPGGGAIASGGWPGERGRSGADTDTPDRHDEDADNER